jgi:GWxTD domain-containing protein
MKQMNFTAKIAALLFLISFQSQAITTFFSYARFSSPQDGTYLETYLTISGNSVIHQKQGNNNYKGAADVAMIFYQNNTIFDARKYTLTSAEQDDSLYMPDFTDVQRFALPAGDYELEIVIADHDKADKQYSSKTKITIEAPKSAAYFSDIEYLESMNKSDKQSVITKGGYDAFPYTSNFFDDACEKILFYSELYNANKSLTDAEKYVVTYSIQDYNTNVILNDYSGFLKKNADAVSPIAASLNIKNLPSGNYNLLLEARNKDNQVFAAQKMFFQRQKIVSHVVDSAHTGDYLQLGDANFELKIKTLDSLVYYVRTLRPISSSLEVEQAEKIIKSKNEQHLRNYLHAFWERKNEKNPEAEFHKYNRRVDECNSMFSTTQMKGFKTDRGRIYLAYGVPDQRAKYENEPSNYPYEIWQYYTIKNFHNRKFVFYNPTLSSNAYRLLHSDMNGETRNDNWKVELDNRSLHGQKSRMNVDNQNGSDYMGNNLDDNFANPR